MIACATDTALSIYLLGVAFGLIVCALWFRFS
jgi:hypothetical protein